jgi:hypothetical protein
MDWQLIIDGNGKALRRILAMLVAMAGLGTGNTLPHHLHRRLLILLRPTEAAVRRLIIIVARELVVTLPPVRAKPKPALDHAAHAALRRLGLAVVIAPGDGAFAALARAGAIARRTAPARPWPTDLPLVDPLSQPFRRSRPFALVRAVPRIWAPDMPKPAPIPRRPLPDDPVDATRLGQRLARVAAALDDLPRHAQRFARWLARRNRDRLLGKRIRWPLRPGFAYGVRRPHSRRPPHEIDAVASDTNYFANLVLERRDSS